MSYFSLLVFLWHLSTRVHRMSWLDFNPHPPPFILSSSHFWVRKINSNYRVLCGVHKSLISVVFRITNATELEKIETKTAQTGMLGVGMEERTSILLIRPPLVS